MAIIVKSRSQRGIKDPPIRILGESLFIVPMQGESTQKFDGCDIVDHKFGECQNRDSDPIREPSPMKSSRMSHHSCEWTCVLAFTVSTCTNVLTVSSSLVDFTHVEFTLLLAIGVHLTLYRLVANL
jgi:hypothetical protein